MEDSSVIQLVRQLTRECRFDFHEVATKLNEYTASRRFTPEECRIIFANDYVPPAEIVPMPAPTAPVEEEPLTFDQVLERQRLRQEQNAKRHEELFQRVLSSLETPDVISAPLPPDILAARQHRLEMQRQQELHEQRLQERDEMRSLQSQRELLRRRYDAGSKDAEGVNIPIAAPQAESKEDSHPILTQFNIETLLSNPHFEQLLSDVERDLNISSGTELAESKEEGPEESISELGEILEYLAKAAKSAPAKPVKPSVPSNASLMPPLPPPVPPSATSKEESPRPSAAPARKAEPSRPLISPQPIPTPSQSRASQSMLPSAASQTSSGRGRYVMHDSDDSGSDDENWRRARDKFKSSAPVPAEVPTSGIWGATTQHKCKSATPAVTLAEKIEALSNSEEVNDDDHDDDDDNNDDDDDHNDDDDDDDDDHNDDEAGEQEEEIEESREKDDDVSSTIDTYEDAPPVSSLATSHVRVDAERLKVSPLLSSPKHSPPMMTSAPSRVLQDQPRGLLESSRSRGQARGAAKFNTSIAKAQQRREGRKNEPAPAVSVSPLPQREVPDQEAVEAIADVAADVLSAPVYSTPEAYLDIASPEMDGGKSTADVSKEDAPAPIPSPRPLAEDSPRYVTIDTAFDSNMSSSLASVISTVQDTFSPIPAALAGFVTLQVKLNCCHSIEPDVSPLSYDVLLAIIFPYILRLVRIINCQLISIVMYQPEITDNSDNSPILLVALNGRPSLRDVLHEKLNNSFQHAYKALNLPQSIINLLHPYERLRLTSIIAILSERLGVETQALVCQPPGQTVLPDADSSVIEFKPYLLSHATTLTQMLCELLVKGYRIIGMRTAFLSNTDSSNKYDEVDFIAPNEVAVLAMALQCPHSDTPLGQLRDILGPEDPELARATSASSFRALYGENTTRNLCHPIRLHPRSRSSEVMTWFGARPNSAKYGALILPQRAYIGLSINLSCVVCPKEAVNLEHAIQIKHSELQRQLLDLIGKIMRTMCLADIRIEENEELGYKLNLFYTTDAAPPHIDTVLSNLGLAPIWGRHNFWELTMNSRVSIEPFIEEEDKNECLAVSSSTIPAHFFESHGDCDIFDTILVALPQTSKLRCSSYMFLQQLILQLPCDCNAHLAGCKTVKSSSGSRIYAMLRGKRIIESIHDTAERVVVNCVPVVELNCMSAPQLLQHHDIRFISGRKAYEALCRHNLVTEMSLPRLHYTAHVPSYIRVDHVMPLFPPGIINQLTVVLVPFDNATTSQLFRIAKKIEKENCSIVNITHTLVTPAVAAALLEEYRLYYGEYMDITRAVLCAAGVQHVVVLVRGGSAVQKVRTLIGPPDSELASAQYPNSMAAMRSAGVVSVPLCPLSMASANRIIQSIYKVAGERISVYTSMQDLQNENVLDLSILCNIPAVIAVEDGGIDRESERDILSITYSWDTLPESLPKNISEERLHIPEGMDTSCIVVSAALLREVGAAAILGAFNKESLKIVYMNTLSLSTNCAKNVLQLAGASSLSIKPPLSLLTRLPVLVIAVEGTSYAVMRLRSLLQVDHAGMQFGGLASLQNSALARCKNGEWGVVLSSSARLAHQLSLYCCRELCGSVKLDSLYETEPQKDEMTYHTPPQSPSRWEPTSVGSEKYFTPSTSTKKRQDSSQDELGNLAMSLEKQF